MAPFDPMFNRMTVYLPDELKLAIEREAARRRCSEARVIREAVAAAVTRPRPNAGLLSHEPIANRMDELSADFGER